MNKFIVSSAIEETWHKNGKNIFMGKWCCIYSKKSALCEFNYEILKFHWDDEEKLKHDINFLKEINKEYIKKISRILNFKHSTNHSERYWEILIGWWFITFSQILFDRWFMAKYAEKKFPNAEIIRIIPMKKLPSSKDTSEFLDQASNSEYWNERLSSDIFENFSSIKINYTNKVQEPPVYLNSEITNKLVIIQRLYLVIMKSIKKISSSSLSLSLESTYLNKFSRFKLHFLTKTFPAKFISWKFEEKSASTEFRNWEFPNREYSEFRDVLEYFAPRYLPTCFLEDYENNQKSARIFSNYYLPKTLLTANDFAENDSWKFWAAHCIEQGSKLIIAQHGGLYGSAEYLATEDYEISISDQFLTWGWKKYSDPKIITAPAMRLVGMKKYSYKPNKKCLLVTMALPRRSYHLGSFPIGPQYEDYLNDQFSFVRNLNINVLNNLTVKLYPADYNWEQKLRWAEFSQDIILDTNSGNMDYLMKQTKLFISTYNATTFLESFKRNLPTVIYWDPTRWKISKDASPYYEVLKNASILFDDPELAAKHVNIVWDHVDDWWKSNEVVSAVSAFSKQFAFTGDRPLNELKNTILNIWK